MSHYTYSHSRESDGQIFYIGKGSGRRAWAFGKRSEYWKRVAAKHGVTVQILATWPSEQEAFEHEKLLIACFLGMGHELCNHTAGGDGASGWKHSPETIAKIRQSNLGRKRSPEAVANSRKARAEWLESGINAFWTIERRQEMSRRFAGVNHPNYGKKYSDALRAKLSAAHKGQCNAASMKPVVCVETGRRFASGVEAAKWLQENGRHTARGSYVTAAAQGKFGTAYGYRWIAA